MKCRAWCAACSREGESMATLTEPFVVVSRFDAGGLGELFHCRDARGVEFAAKFPKGAGPEAQRMIDDEERRFCRHQGAFVVQYLQPVRHQDGRRGFAMELMEGSLSALVAQQGALAPARALVFFGQMARGLAEVHASAMGAFHGDLKLANVLFRGATAKLADFGLARGGVGQTIYFGAHQGGTPGYMPPEGLASAKGDVYSAGVVLWAMLAGREPDPGMGPNQQLVLRPELHGLLEGMLCRDPARRLSIQQVLQRLATVGAECGLVVAPAPVTSSGPRVGEVVLGAMLLAGAVAAISAFFGGGKEWDSSVGRYRGPDGKFVSG